MRSSDADLDPRVPLAAWYLCRAQRIIWNLPLLAGLLDCLALVLLRQAAQDQLKARIRDHRL